MSSAAQSATRTVSRYRRIAADESVGARPRGGADVRGDHRRAMDLVDGRERPPLDTSDRGKLMPLGLARSPRHNGELAGRPAMDRDFRERH